MLGSTRLRWRLVSRLSLGRAEGFYEVEARFGPVEVSCTAITTQSRQAHAAQNSYRDNVQADEPAPTSAGGAR